MATARRQAGRKPPGTLPISRARQELCPLVESIARAPQGRVAITVGEEVAAYLVSPAKLAELEEKARAAAGPRPSLVGSIVVHGEIEDLEAGVRAEARAQEAHALGDWDEPR